MSSLKTKGRMINKGISDSKRFASLSPPAAVLFCLIIPHLNSHGKTNGAPEYIKGEICPRISYLSVENIYTYMEEINEKTNVKWFKVDGRYWIHSINFLNKHQKLDKSKLGQDLLPNYLIVTPELVIPEVEVEVEVEVEEKEKIYKKEKALQFFLLWNQFALKSNFISARELSDSRKQKASKRLSERPLVEWEKVFSLCARTPFLNGLSKDGWRASFDWITASYDNAVKILEGKYGQPLDEFCTQEVLEKLKKKGGENNGHRKCQQRTPETPGNITAKQDVYAGISQKISTDE